MARIYPAIDRPLRDFVAAQKVFFVATAPLSADGHVNISPKGLDSFRVLGPTTVAYADLTGSGAETIAHVRENGRVAILFCAFEGPPKIVRLHGRGEVVGPGHVEFPALRSAFPEFPGLRAIIRLRCTRLSESCGFAVPRYRFVGERSELTEWAGSLGEAGLETYCDKKNRTSLDGLPALPDPP